MSEKALQIILDHSQKGLALRQQFFDESGPLLVNISKEIAVSLAKGGKVLFCGNGGSAADAQHLAAEFVNRFQLERPPLPGLALTTDTSILTAISNDYSFDDVFLKQVQAFGNPGDMLIGLSTSGMSPNVVRALQAAQEREMTTVGFSGKNGGDMFPHCTHMVLVDSSETPLIQEIHIAAGHLLCRLVDFFLFESVGDIEPLLNNT